jgi:hypothetical protein
MDGPGAARYTHHSLIVRRIMRRVHERERAALCELAQLPEQIALAVELGLATSASAKPLCGDCEGTTAAAILEPWARPGG